MTAEDLDTTIGMGPLRTEVRDRMVLLRFHLTNFSTTLAQGVTLQTLISNHTALLSTGLAGLSNLPIEASFLQAHLITITQNPLNSLDTLVARTPDDKNASTTVLQNPQFPSNKPENRKDFQIQTA